MHKKERPDSHGLHTGFHMASIKQYGDMWRAFVCVGGTRRTRVLRTKREATAWASADYGGTIAATAPDILSGVKFSFDPETGSYNRRIVKWF